MAVGLNVFFVQDHIYTSKSKVLPVSDSGGSTNAFLVLYHNWELIFHST